MKAVTVSFSVDMPDEATDRQIEERVAFRDRRALAVQRQWQSAGAYRPTSQSQLSAYPLRKITMRSYILAVCVGIASAPISSQAANWIPVRTASDGITALDTQSVSAAGGKLIKAWVKNSFPAAREAGTTPPFSFQSYLSLRVFDCAHRSSDLLQQVFYAGPDGTGEIVKNQSYPRDKIKLVDVVPDTLGEDLLVFACEAAKVRKKK